MVVGFLADIKELAAVAHVIDTLFQDSELGLQGGSISLLDMDDIVCAARRSLSVANYVKLFVL